MDHYYTIKRREETLLKVEGSKFIAEAYPVFTPEEAEEYLRAVRKAYYDATHHCFAWALGEHRETFHYSDDGEPSGTAGVKIFSAVQSAKMSDILIVVTRYFGGTKLGVGGLGRAYFDAATEVLKRTESVMRIPVIELTAEVSYSFVTPVMNLCARNDVAIDRADYAQDVTFRLLVPVERAEACARQLIELTNGTARVTTGARLTRSVL
ncbi:MAG TPA: YigZ family protein [Bacteroidota bacterium]|nr:YigZ family protein [Bacteroidota bacterium]